MGDVVGTTSPACTPTPGSSAAGLSRTPHRRPQRYDAVCMHSYVTTQPSPLRYNTAFTVTLQHSCRRYVTTQPSPLRYNTAFAVTLNHSLHRYVTIQYSSLRYCRKYDLQTSVTTMFSLLDYCYMFLLLNMMKTQK